MKKRILAFILAAVLLLACLAGCSKNSGTDSPSPGQNASDSKNDKNNEPGKEPGKRPSSEFDTEYTYVPTYVDMTTEDGSKIEWINRICVVGETVFFTAEVVTGKQTGSWIDEKGEEQTYEYDTYDTRLFRVSAADGKIRKLEGYETIRYPEGVDGYSYVEGMIAAQDGTLWILESGRITIYDLPEDFDETKMDRWEYYSGEETSLRLVHLDAEGSVLDDNTIQFDGGMNLYDFRMDGKGYLYSSDYENIYVFKTDGTKVGQIADASGAELMQIGSKVCASIWGETGRVVRSIDPEALTLGETEPVTDRAWNFFEGFGDYGYLYDYNGVIYGFNQTTGKEERVLSWLDCDVDSNYINGYAFLPDGNAVAMEQKYNEQDGTQTYSLIRLERVLTSSLPQKKEIVYACMYLDWNMRTRIVNFNKTHNDVRIVVHDYSEFNTEEDYQAGMTKLNAEILSGQMPDILALDQLPVSRYAAKGLLTDLWPLIDADPDLGRDGVMENVFDALSIDGKLYQAASSFTIQTVMGNSDIVGDGESWTLDELLAAKAQMDEGATIFGEYDTKAGILQNCVCRDLGAFIDWGKGACNFDSQEFIDLLKFADSFPKEFNWEDYDYEMPYESDFMKLRSGKQMLLSCYLYSLTDFQRNRAIFGENSNFIGYPTTQGNGSTFQVNNTIGITAGCSDVDAAWSFVREVLLEKNQTSDYMYQFPTNRKAFDTYVEQAMTIEYYTDENGEQVPMPKIHIYIDDTTEPLELYAMTQEEVDAFMKLYNSIHTVYGYDQTIMEIVDTQVAPFFDGQASAEETARLLQSRVSLYIAEQR